MLLNVSFKTEYWTPSKARRFLKKYGWGEEIASKRSTRTDNFLTYNINIFNTNKHSVRRVYLDKEETILLSFTVTKDCDTVC